MSTPLSIVGIGAVSPLGDDAIAHAVRVRAKLRPAVASAFRRGDEALPVLHVPWLDLGLTAPERLATLARTACAEATPDLEEKPALFLVTPPPRPGFDRDVATALGLSLGRPDARFEGEAGAFAAIEAAQAWLSDGRAKSVAVVAVDSFASCDALTSVLARPPSPWAKLPLPFAEGAFALRLAARGARSSIATLESVATAPGAGTDEDDDPVDGVALTDLFRSLPPRGPIRFLWGQEDVDDLRERDLRITLARTASLYAPDLATDSIERFTGRLGAAAGLANLVQGVALSELQSTEAASPFVAWAISRDGTRGVALARGGAS